MDSTKDFRRTTIPFDTPIQIPKRTREILVNSFGLIRGELDGGVLKFQAKKHASNEREVILINTNVTPPTIEIRMEKDES